MLPNDLYHAWEKIEAGIFPALEPIPTGLELAGVNIKEVYDVESME